MTSDLARGFASGILVAMLAFSTIWYLSERARGGQRLPADLVMTWLHRVAMGAKAVADAFEGMVRNYRYMRENYGKEANRAM